MISGIDKVEATLAGFRKYSVTNNFNTGSYVSASAISTDEQLELQSHITGTNIRSEFARKFMVYDPYTTGIRCLSTAEGSRINPSTGLCTKSYFTDASILSVANKFNNRVGAQFKQLPTTDNDFQFYAALGDHFRFHTNNQSRFKVSYYYFIPSTNFKLNRLRGGVSNERFHTGGRFAQAFHLTDGSLVPTASDTVIGSWTLHTGLLKANLTNTSCPDGITGAELLIMGAYGSDTSNDFYGAGDNGDSFYLSDVIVEQITTEEVGETAPSIPKEVNAGNYTTLVFEATGHFRDRNQMFTAGFSFDYIIGGLNPTIEGGRHLTEGTQIRMPENQYGFTYVLPTITGYQRLHDSSRKEQVCKESTFRQYFNAQKVEPRRARLFNITGVSVDFAFNNLTGHSMTGFDFVQGVERGIPTNLVPITTNFFHGAFTWPMYVGKSGEAISGLEDGDFSRMIVESSDSSLIRNAKIASGVDLDYDVLGPINVSTPIQGPGDGFGENIVTGNILKTGLMCFRYNRFWSEPSGTANHIPASGTTIDYNQKTYKNNGTSLTYGTGNVYITAFEPATYEYDKVAAFGLTTPDGYTPLEDSYTYDSQNVALSLVKLYKTDKFCAVGAATELTSFKIFI